MPVVTIASTDILINIQCIFIKSRQFCKKKYEKNINYINAF